MKMYGDKKESAAAPNSKGKSKKKKKKSKAKVVISVLLVLLVIGLVVAALAWRYVRPPEAANPVNGNAVNQERKSDIVADDQLKITDSERKKDFFNILILGTDLNGYHTDSIMIASFDIASKKVKVLSVPRDTMINVKRSNKKINAAYSVNGKPGNIDELYDELESVLGFKPDKYVCVSTGGFVKMIDAIGGVDVDVQRDMKYSDPTQDLFIDIKKGQQTLNGYDSMCFMRYRYGYVEGDVGRVRAQQQFVKALMNKMLTPASLSKMPELADIIAENVKTDLSTGNIIWLGKEALNLNVTEDVQTFILPGEGQYYKHISYFVPYEHKTLELVNEHFNPFVDPIEDVNIIDFEKISGIKLGLG